MGKIRGLYKENYEMIYLLALNVFLASTIIGEYTFAGGMIPGAALTLLRLLCVAIVAGKIIAVDIKKYSSASFVGVSFLGLFLCLSAVLSANTSYVQFFILILGSFQIPFKKIAKTVLIFELALVLVIILLNATGILHDPYSTFGRNNSDVVRYNFGFKHNTLPQFFWYFTMLFLYIKGKKTKLWMFPLLFVFNIVVYHFTDSRNEFLCTILVIILAFVYRYFYHEKLNKLIAMVARGIMPFFTAVFFAMSILYSSHDSFLRFVNHALSGRLFYTQKTIFVEGIHLFAQKITWVGLASVQMGLYDMVDYNYVDSSYLRILINYGIILFALLMIAYFFVAKYDYEKNDGYFCWIMIILALHSMISPQLMMIAYNIFMLKIVDVIVKTPEYAMSDEDEEEHQYLNLEQIQSQQFAIFNEVIAFLKENDLTYYICGGTLLGAIRHKGFIPWDDDIDILMPRTEYDKLQDLAKTKTINEHLEIHSFELGNLNDPFCKVYDMRTKMQKYYSTDEYDQHMWVDIFPMDGLPADDAETKKIYKKVKRLRMLLQIRKTRDELIISESKTFLKSITKPFIKVTLDLFDKRFFVEKIDKICRKYNFDESEYVGGIAWGYGPQEKLLKANMDTIQVEFEGVMVDTFACYDEYLSNLYGDYMQLPPEDKRVAHIMKIEMA